MMIENRVRKLKATMSVNSKRPTGGKIRSTIIVIRSFSLPQSATNKSKVKADRLGRHANHERFRLDHM